MTLVWDLDDYEVLIHVRRDRPLPYEIEAALRDLLWGEPPDPSEAQGKVDKLVAAITRADLKLHIKFGDEEDR